MSAGYGSSQPMLGGAEMLKMNEGTGGRQKEVLVGLAPMIDFTQVNLQHLLRNVNFQPICPVRVEDQRTFNLTD